MSGPSLSNLVDNGQMLLLGTQCAEATCMQVDFLPFKCPHCNKSYCQTHYKAEDHKCPEYEEFLHNRIAPNCTFLTFMLFAGLCPTHSNSIKFRPFLQYSCRGAPKPRPQCPHGTPFREGV
jgi:hypothetical protein